MNPDKYQDEQLKYFLEKYARSTFIPRSYLEKKDEDILEEMDIKTIERFLRKKKLQLNNA
jgi:hypothetical protein